MRISDWSSDVCSSDLVACLELEFDLLAGEHQALAGDEIERETGLFLEVGLARGAAAGDARAGIGEKQGLLRQPVGVLEPDLDVDEMVRLAGERRAVEEIIGSVLRHAVDDGRVAGDALYHRLRIGIVADRYKAAALPEGRVRPIG